MTTNVAEIEKKSKNRELEDREDLFTVDVICKCIEKGTGKTCGDMWQASQIIWDTLFQGAEAREKLFKEFLKVSTNVNYDWFSKGFNNTAADKKKKHQDFTPGDLGQILDRLIESESKSHEGTRYDVGAGTGSLTIQKWNGDRKQFSPFAYKPSHFWYVAEELKIEGQPSYALPFLLFNFMIRGMNGVVIAGDSLTRSVSQVFFIQNIPDNHLGFSSLNVMPRTKEVEQEFDIRKWIDEPIDYVEDNLEDFFVVDKKDEEQAEREKDELDGMLNIVKKQNANNPDAKKMKDLSKDERDNLGDQLDGILRVFGIEPDKNIRREYFGD